MIRNTAGTTIAKPHTAIPLATSTALGRPYGMNRWSSGVPRASQPSATPGHHQQHANRQAAREGDAVGEPDVGDGDDLHAPHGGGEARRGPMGESGYPATADGPPDPTGPQRTPARALRARTGTCEIGPRCP